jgi:hypothetical protein
LATAVSFLCVIAIVAVLQLTLLWLIAPPLLAATAVSAALSLLTLQGRAGRNKLQQRNAFRNPFAFWSVVGFAIFLGIIVVAGRLVSERMGAMGAILGAAAMGLLMSSHYGFDREACAADLVRAECGRDFGGGRDQHAQQTDDRRRRRKQPLCALSRGNIGRLLRCCGDGALADSPTGHGVGRD